MSNHSAMALRLLLAELNAIVACQGEWPEPWIPGVLRGVLCGSLGRAADGARADASATAGSRVGSAARLVAGVGGGGWKEQRAQVDALFTILAPMPRAHYGGELPLAIGELASELATSFQMPWPAKASAVLMRELVLAARGGVVAFATALRHAPALVVECARSLPLRRYDGAEGPSLAIAQVSAVMTPAALEGE